MSEKWGCQTLYGDKFQIWSPALRGPRSSTALFDPYTFAHLVGAGLQFLLIPPAWEEYNLALWQLFIINFAVHLLFEIWENSPCAIQYCRKLPGHIGDDNYKGDSVLNVMGDLIAFSVGYLTSAALFQLRGIISAACVPLSALLVFTILYRSE